MGPLYNAYMDPLSTKKRSSYELLKQELETYRIRNTSYSFTVLLKMLEMHGWTLEEYNDAYQEELVVRKLKYGR